MSKKVTLVWNKKHFLGAIFNPASLIRPNTLWSLVTCSSKVLENTIMRMPFGLSCAGATFECLMEYALAGLQWETCIIYLDDIIVFSRTFEEHVTRLQSVFFSPL
jgi:hypothetical protein